MAQQSIRLNAPDLPSWDRCTVLCRTCIFFREKSILNATELCVYPVEILGGDKPEILSDKDKVIGCSYGIEKE